MILKNILEALFKEYPNIQKKWIDFYEKEEYKQRLPKVNNIQELSYLITPDIVHIINVKQNEICCIGFEFSCTWEEEHGLGFMTYQGKVCKIGDASVSFLSQIA